MPPKKKTEPATVSESVSITLPMPLVKAMHAAARYALSVNGIADSQTKAARDLVAYFEMRFPELKGNA